MNVIEKENDQRQQTPQPTKPMLRRRSGSFSTVEIDNSHVIVKRMSRFTNVKIPLHNILSCTKTSKVERVILNFVKYSSKNEMVLAKQIIYGKQELIQQFHKEVELKIKETSKNRPRRLLVFINPFAGRKKGEAVFNQMKPIFDCADVKCHTVVMTRPGYAKRHILESKELYSYDGVLSVGGDGTMNEVITGLMIRCQTDLKLDFENPANDQMPCLLPIGIIPAGTINTFVQWLHGTTDATTAVLHIIRGRQEKSNVYSIHQNKELTAYAGLYLGIGLGANVLKTANTLRCLGKKRYFISYIINILKRLDCVKMKFAYKKVRSTSVSDSVCYTEQDWKIVEGEFKSVDSVLMNLEENSSEAKIHFGENYSQMFLLSSCSRKRYYHFFHDLLNYRPRVFQLSFVNPINIKIARIEFLDMDHDSQTPVLASDGETVDIISNQIDVRLHTRVISVFGCRQ